MVARIVVLGDAMIVGAPEGGSGAPGGAGFQVAVDLTVLGFETALVAMVGDDDGGAAIRAGSEERGVELLATRAPHGSAEATRKENVGGAHLTYNDAALARRIGFDAAQVAAIDAAELVVVSSFPFDDRFQAEALENAVREPRRRLVVDANPRPGLLRDLDRFAESANRAAGGAALVKLSDEDAQLLYGTGLSDAEELLLRRGTAAVLGTAGRHGAGIVTQDGIRVHESVVPLRGPVVDPSGAGAAVLAAVVAALVTEADRDERFWERALYRAMEIAAATCRAEGPLLRLP